MRITTLAYLLFVIAACGEVSSPTIDASPIDGPEADAAIDAPIDAPPDAAPIMRTITIAVGGNGTGSVTSTPAGLNCPGTCTLTVADGASVTLIASATGTSTFVGWSGGSCSGTAPCTFTATADTTINASFGQNFSLIVTKTGTGSGTVTSAPAGIACGADCDQTYAAGTAVTLTATSSLDSNFTGWSGGGCAGTGLCTVTITGAVAVNATFTQRQQTLTTAVLGTGGGTITGTGINCGADCNEAYPFGTVVPLTATPDATSTFAGWVGDCTGTGACSVTMDADRNVRATFTRNQATLTVTTAGTGAGTVASNPVGINCGADCTEPYAQGTTVTLTAIPAVGSTFAGWSGGGCTGTGACVVAVTAAVTVTATFTLNTYTLTVARAGTGTGTVISSPAGINCGATCSALFGHGTAVTLTATPAVGSTIAGWSGGGCSGTATTCVVTMTAATSVTVTFTLNTYTLTVAKIGAGTGTVTSSPAGISCGATCSAVFSHGTAVVLTATPTAGHTFAGWSGGGCTGTGTCTVTMTAATTVSAQFNPPANIVFVTSTTHTGNLGGLAGADAICQARAVAGGLPSGTYRAWLSTTTGSAISRLGSASGWVRPDGKPVANTTADLAAGKMFYPIRINETGADVQEVGVLTTTTANGTLHPSSTDCSVFTVADTQSTATGVSSNVSSSFTIFGFGNCANASRLYCFGVSNTATVTVTPPPTFRRAFITNASWTPGGGLAAADALCTSEATGAALPGTYKAMLATATASAQSRFNTAAGTAPWARVDGVQLAPTAAGLFTSTFWDTGMTVLANGTYMNSGNSGVWGGATSPSAVGTAALTCGGTWSSTTGTGGGGRNGLSRVGGYFAFDTTNACNATFIKLTCLQE